MIMIAMMKIMLKMKIKNIFKNLKNSEWSFLTITITITNKTLITNQTFTGKEKETNKQQYLLHPHYEKTTLSNAA